MLTSNCVNLPEKQMTHHDGSFSRTTAFVHVLCCMCSLARHLLPLYPVCFNCCGLYPHQIHVVISSWRLCCSLVALFGSPLLPQFLNPSLAIPVASGCALQATPCLYRNFARLACFDLDPHRQLLVAGLGLRMAASWFP